MVKLGVVGYGYWGPNLVRNFSMLNNCIIKTISDSTDDKLGKVKRLYPHIHTTKFAEDIFNDCEIDCVIIATPVFTHYKLAKAALLKEKHVLIEKPMTSCSTEAQELIDLAEKKEKVLMVDHTYLYTGSVKKIKEIIIQGDIGDLQYFDSTRINLGLFQPDINVIWDLAPHDISILQHIMDEKPSSVTANGISHTNNMIENIAYITLYFNSNRIAHFNCSWASPVKIRKILIGGTKKMIEFDDLAPTEKVKIYDTGYRVISKEDEGKILVDYRTGDIYIPKVEQTEALYGVANDFINAVTNGIRPIADYNSGLYVVKVLEAAEKSLKAKGKEVVIA